MSIDLSNMSRKELLALIDQAQSALRDAETRERAEARKAAEKAAAEFGFSLSDVLDAGDSSRRKSEGKTVSPPKFRNPENADQTWTGRGRKPAWFTEALARGVSPDDMEI